MVEVDYRPAALGCPSCEQSAHRVWSTRRWAIDANLDDLGLLSIRVGVYRCGACGHLFRGQPPFIRPGATYTNRVVRLAVQAVFEDGMAISRVPERMARDFWTRPSEASVRLWCRQWADQRREGCAYEPWIVSRFSGTLCVDELYEGNQAVLVAADPRAADGDRLLAYSLVAGRPDKRDTLAFLSKLKEMGLEPEQVVSDGSPLYPEALARLWPKAAHQLCLFHEARRVVKSVFTIVRRVLASMATPPQAQQTRGRLRKSVASEEPSPLSRRARMAWVVKLHLEGASQRVIRRLTHHGINTIRQWLREAVEGPKPLSRDEIEAATPASNLSELPAPPAPCKSWEEMRQFKRDLKEWCHLLAARRSRLKEEALTQVDALLASPMASDLACAHRFAQCWYQIWHEDDGARSSVQAARAAFVSLRQDGAAARLAPLHRMQRRMTDEAFHHLAPFLTHPLWEATNNGDERSVRQYRHLHASRYRWRTARSA